MPIVQAGKIKLACEVSGSGEAGNVVLIRGQGTQLIHWPKTFYSAFVERGFRTVRFDNRDAGLSEKFDAIDDREIEVIRKQISMGNTVDPPYTLEDMALDVIHLMDVLNVDKAHIVGMSMGGYIAQIMAAEYAARVQTMTSIMSGSTFLNPSAREALFSERKSRDEFIEDLVAYVNQFGSPMYADSEEHSRSLAAETFDRCYSPDGANRQLLAIYHSAQNIDLQTLAQSISVPTLVLHGSDDRLIPPVMGRQTAELIPGATFKLIEGMGHDTPHALGRKLADLVLTHMYAAGQTDHGHRVILSIAFVTIMFRVPQEA